ncbi:MAG: outer membrane lipid asymmetry maintenance protein MlaD [Gammaproteobacteria bacterium]|nr:outer membrane lipid asymmetry maintenance protein MlaD [Gammaproteobacteria bacterium]
MNHKSTTEIAVGIFVAIGLAALFMLAMKVSNLSNATSDNTYALTAKFENIGGLKVRSPVMMAGVRIGQVTDVRVDAETFEAVVTMEIEQRFTSLPKDTSASILTSGLLGEQYLGLEAGGDSEALKHGDEIRITQSAFVLEQVIGQFLFKKAAGDE